MRFLERNNVISIVRRTSFSNDIEYLEHLKNCNADLLLGSQWDYRTQQYTYRTELDEILSKREKVFFNHTDRGLLLKKSSLKMCVAAVDISVRPCQISDINAKYDSQKDVYATDYSEYIPLEYTEAELSEYLQNSRNIIDISIRLHIQHSKETVGELLSTD